MENVTLFDTGACVIHLGKNETVPAKKSFNKAVKPTFKTENFVEKVENGIGTLIGLFGGFTKNHVD